MQRNSAPADDTYRQVLVRPGAFRKSALRERPVAAEQPGRVSLARDRSLTAQLTCGRIK
jgi:hypothetical protein